MKTEHPLSLQYGVLMLAYDEGEIEDLRMDVFVYGSSGSLTIATITRRVLQITGSLRKLTDLSVVS